MSRWQADDDRGGVPVPGYFEMTLVSKGRLAGPIVPARIMFEGGMWQASINGKLGPADPDPSKATGVYRIWHKAQRSTQEACAYLEAVKAWAEKHDANHPALRPYDLVDNTQLAPVIP